MGGKSFFPHAWKLLIFWVLAPLTWVLCPEEGGAGSLRNRVFSPGFWITASGFRCHLRSTSRKMSHWQRKSPLVPGEETIQAGTKEFSALSIFQDSWRVGFCTCILNTEPTGSNLKHVLYCLDFEASSQWISLLLVTVN